MAIQVGDVWAFALEQTLFGQQVINTFALKVTLTPNSLTEGFFLNERFAVAGQGFNQANDILGDFRDLQTPQVGYKQWRVKRVTGVLTNEFIFPITDNIIGAHPGDCETANISMSIDRKGLTAGKRSRGRIAVAGLATTSMSAGKWDEETLVIATRMSGDITGVKTVSTGVTFEMGFWNPGGERIVKEEKVIYLPLFTHAVSSLPKDTVRVQRSRTLGVGS